MELAKFGKEIDNLFLYYSKTAPDYNVVSEQWFPEVKYIPQKAFEWIIARIKERAENPPRNIPKYIKALFYEYKDVKQYTEPTYNADYDDSYPVRLMHQAFDILEKNGRDEFLKFADATGMPKSDRKRVVGKYKYQRSRGQ
jgi:hypothetical protein